MPDIERSSVNWRCAICGRNIDRERDAYVVTFSRPDDSSDHWSRGVHVRCGEPRRCYRNLDPRGGVPVAESEREEAQAFYRKARWDVGTLVCDVDDPARFGTIVKRGGTIWTTRDKAPLVRWHGRVDAESVPYDRLNAR